MGQEKRINQWFTRRYKQGREYKEIFWKRYGRHGSKAAVERYKRIRNYYTKTRREE